MCFNLPLTSMGLKRAQSHQSDFFNLSTLYQNWRIGVCVFVCMYVLCTCIHMHLCEHMHKCICLFLYDFLWNQKQIQKKTSEQRKIFILQTQTYELYSTSHVYIIVCKNSIIPCVFQSSVLFQVFTNNYWKVLCPAFNTKP